MLILLCIAFFSAVLRRTRNSTCLRWVRFFKKIFFDSHSMRWSFPFQIHMNMWHSWNILGRTLHYSPLSLKHWWRSVMNENEPYWRKKWTVSSCISGPNDRALGLSNGEAWRHDRGRLHTEPAEDTARAGGSRYLQFSSVPQSDLASDMLILGAVWSGSTPWMRRDAAELLRFNSCHRLGCTIDLVMTSGNPISPIRKPRWLENTAFYPDRKGL